MLSPILTIKKKAPAQIAIVPPAESFSITAKASPIKAIETAVITHASTNLFIEAILPLMLQQEQQ